MSDSGLPNWEWVVGIGHQLDTDEEEHHTRYIVAPHRSAAKRKAAEDVDWSPEYWMATPKGYHERMNPELVEVANEMAEAITLGLIVTVTMPLWFPPVFLIDWLGIADGEDVIDWVADRFSSP